MALGHEARGEMTKSEYQELVEFLTGRLSSIDSKVEALREEEA